MRLLLEDTKAQGAALLKGYVAAIDGTDRLPPDVRPALMGLFGEVGSLMATSKKRLRDEDAYTEYREVVCEEFGDVLWYLGAVCRRLNISIEEIFRTTAEVQLPFEPVPVATSPPNLEETLVQLGEGAATLLYIRTNTGEAKHALSQFVDCYLRAMFAIGVTFPEVIKGNIAKTRGGFLEPDLRKMPVFDNRFDAEEQLPWEFEIEITQRKSGHSYLRWNGVFIGDPLTDNIADKDGYRFHDVFHFAHAAVLHWSPVFRSLIKQKRKSDKVIDETQDGGRSIVIEEGLTAYIFARAKKLDYFATQERVAYDLLKTVQRFVRGYEVDACPASLWQRAILQGYEVFRQIRNNEGGIVVGNRKLRTIEYRAIRRG